MLVHLWRQLFRKGFWRCAVPNLEANRAGSTPIYHYVA